MFNQFFVIIGEIGVRTGKGYTTRLQRGQTFTVEPGVLHEFITYEERAIVEEVAYVQFDENDIIRKRLGGASNGASPEHDGDAEGSV